VIHDLHIAIAEMVKGPIKVLYAGTDILEAQKKFDAAGPEIASVSIISHPMPVRMRYPAEEAAAAERRAKQAELDATAEVDRKIAAAKKAEDQAQELIDHAKALRESAEPKKEK
jgi:hypothetical protein